MQITFHFIEHIRKNLEEIETYIDTDMDSPVSSTRSESETNSNMFHVETQRKTPDQILGDRKNEMEISQTSNSGDDSPMEGTSIVRTKLPSGKVSILYFIMREKEGKIRNFIIRKIAKIISLDCTALINDSYLIN